MQEFPFQHSNQSFVKQGVQAVSNNLVDAEMSLPVTSLPEHDLPGIEALPEFDSQDEAAEFMMRTSIQIGADLFHSMDQNNPGSDLEKS
jgi:hypothetical protein